MRGTKGRGAGVLACMLLAVIAEATVARAEIIDRVLAVVSGQIVTLSDVSAALQLGLVSVESADDPIAAALETIIDRRLMLTEVERYRPAEPTPEMIEAGVAAVRARFPDARAFDTALDRTGMTLDALRRHVRDRIRLEAYLQQRFAILQATTEDLQTYYREHPEEFTRDGTVAPFEQVREQVRARVLTVERERFVRDWVEGLRRRTSVVVLYLPGR